MLFLQDLTSDDYFGLGLRRGMLHLSWNLGWLSRAELSVPSPLIADGRWHTVRLSRVKQALQVR